LLGIKLKANIGVKIHSDNTAQSQYASVFKYPQISNKVSTAVIQIAQRANKTHPRINQSKKITLIL
jgi:hypothetical protein